MWTKIINRYNNSKFKSKLILIFIFSSILPIFMILLISSRLNTRNMTDKVDQLMVSNLTQIAQRVNINLEVYTNMLYQIYQDEEIAGNIKILMGDGSTGKAVAYNKINSRLKLYNTGEAGVRCISIICKDGSAVINDFETSSLVDNLWSAEPDLLGIKPYLEAEGRPGMVITPTMAYREKGSIKHYFHISKRMFDLNDLEQGSIATVVMSVDSDVLNRICNTAPGEGQEAGINFIMSEKDTVITYPDGDFSGIHKNPELSVAEFVEVSGLLKDRHTAVNSYRDPVTGWIFYNVYDKDSMLTDVRKSQLLYFVIGIVAMALSSVLILLLARRLNQSVSRLVAGIKEVEEGNLEVRVPIAQRDEIGEITENFNTMTVKVRELIAKVKEATDKQKNAEIRALEAQINPHFLYNTLDSINWMAIEHEEYEISKMLRNLGIILRYSVNKSNTLVTVAEAADWLDKYIGLHRMRFDGAFTYDIRIGRGAGERKIHKLLLQPFIENAILHGFKGMESGGRLSVTINAAEPEGMLAIIIEDNGRGMPEEKLKQYNDPEQAVLDDGRSIGLHNAFSRMKMYYGEQAGWRLSSIEGMGTVITLKLPPVGEERSRTVKDEDTGRRG